ncbi:questin oxidase family protein [Actinokineospora sp. HUAS TT18]|uniref:questin oxidase family protein n=1 Tax=Actinokineospora sp. HUAS TT18 TaxID=3447451 RepID=UPI003F523A8B
MSTIEFGAASRASLLSGLDRISDGGFEFMGHLSNHGPMVADALVEIGASAVVEDWCEVYRPRLGNPPPHADPIAEHDWREALGAFSRVADWTALFLNELQDAPWEDVFRRWWPRLLPGVAAAGTHGVIRTAHAVRMLSREEAEPDELLLTELARGLGYWASRYHELPGRPSLRGTRSAADALNAIRPIAADVAIPGRGIMGHLALPARLPDFDQDQQNYGSPSSVELSITELTAAGAQMLIRRMDIPVVITHLVTAPSALRFVLPYLSERQAWESVARVWQVMAGIVRSFPAPTAPRPLPAAPVPEAEALIDLSVGHGDEHVVKLAEAAIRETATSPDPVYFRAADMARRFLKPFPW